MAPTGSRRSGYSRRAQYNLFTGYVIAGIGALIGAILLALSFFQPHLFGGLRGTAQSGVSPATETAASVWTASKGLGSDQRLLPRRFEECRVEARE